MLLHLPQKMNFQMTDKPAFLGIEYAKRFQDKEVVKSYRFRPPYPQETFEILSGLIRDTPRHVLDVGCGTGDIARRIVDHVVKVDAVDFSAAMINTAKSLPNGDNPNIHWVLGRIEDAELGKSYSLIVGGESLHWMDWDIAFQRFRLCLSPKGFLAIVERDEEPLPWKDELKKIIRKYSTIQSFDPDYPMIEEWERRGFFKKTREVKTGSIDFAQTFTDYLESFHSTSSLTRRAMGDNAEAFDEEVLQLVSKHSKKSTVERRVFASIVWGNVLGSAH